MSLRPTPPSRSAARPLHIAVVGPMTLSLLAPELGGALSTAGYPFPATAELVLEYLRLGHRVSAITTATDITAPIRRVSDRLDLVVLPARGRGRRRAFDFFRAERHAITAAIEAAGPDVVHAHWTYEFGLAARRATAPALVTVHDWAPAIARFNRHPYWYFRWAMQVRCLLEPGALSAPSAYVADRVRRFYRRSCSVVPNGVDLAHFEPSTSSPPALTVAMLNVGFSTRKNVAVALEAWPMVRARVPAATLVLAGPEYEPGGLAHGWASARGLLDGVRFDGPLDPDDVPGWLSGKTLFLHTSREESFGIVLVEAMASGVPLVVGRSSGAAADVVGAAGMTTVVEDPEAVAATVARLLEDEGARARMIASGLRNAEAYALPTVVDEYLGLLRDAVESTRRRKTPSGAEA